MVQTEILCDGWRQFHTSKGILFRWNREHVQRCVTAIRHRYENEVEVTFEQPKSKVVHMKLKTKV